MTKVLSSDAILSCLPSTSSRSRHFPFQRMDTPPRHRVPSPPHRASRTECPQSSLIPRQPPQGSQSQSPQPPHTPRPRPLQPILPTRRRLHLHLRNQRRTARSLGIHRQAQDILTPGQRGRCQIARHTPLHHHTLTDDPQRACRAAHHPLHRALEHRCGTYRRHHRRPRPGIQPIMTAAA